MAWTKKGLSFQITSAAATWSNPSHKISYMSMHNPILQPTEMRANSTLETAMESNQTGDFLTALFMQYSEEMDIAEKVQSFVNPVLALISMCMNFYIARLVFINKNLHKFTYIMVAYQAVVDSFLVCPLKVYLELNQRLDLHGDAVVCTLTALYNVASITTTAPVLLFLCVERTFLVVYPVQGKIWLENVGTKLFFAINLGTSVIYTLWLLLGTEVSPDSHECIMTFRAVSVTATGIIFFFVFYAIPLLFMVTLYPVIAFRLMNSPSNRNYNTNKRISKLLAVSTLAFAVLWAPLMINSVWIIIGQKSWASVMQKSAVGFYIYGFAILFISVYSAINPCIYIMLTRPIREPIVSRVTRGREELKLKQIPLLHHKKSRPSNETHLEGKTVDDALKGGNQEGVTCCTGLMGGDRSLMPQSSVLSTENYPKPAQSVKFA